MAKITFTNTSDKAINISLLGRSGSTTILPGKKDDVDGTLEISIDPVVWYSTEALKTFYTETYGGIDGVSYQVEDDSSSLNATVAVTTTEGAAIEGASVQYDTETKQTNSEGIATFEDISAKTVTITVTKEGYDTTTLSDVSISGNANESFHIVLVTTE